MQPLNDDEIVDLARELHRMWHAGASQAEAIERAQRRLSRGQWQTIPRLYRPWFTGFIKIAFLRPVWGDQACGPDHDVVICDEPQPAGQV